MINNFNINLVCSARRHLQWCKFVGEWQNVKKPSYRLAVVGMMGAEEYM